MPTPTLLEAALAAVRAGCAVFPCYEWVAAAGRCACGRPAATAESPDGCRSPGKHPRTLEGFEDASTNPAAVAAWWAAAPGAALGIATGEPSGRLLVLDVEAEGLEAWEALAREHDDLPATPTAETGGGGLHVYLRYPAGRVVRCRTRLRDLPLDVRAAGGYVVAPPSPHRSGRAYRWWAGRALGEVEVADAPAWVLDMATARGGRVAAPVGAGGAAAVEDEVREGGRHDALTRLAGTLRRRGLASAEIEAALAAVNLRRCRPPLGVDEVASIAASAGAWEGPVGGGLGGGVGGEVPPVGAVAVEPLGPRPTLVWSRPEGDVPLSEVVPAATAALAARCGGDVFWRDVELVRVVRSPGRTPVRGRAGGPVAAGGGGLAVERSAAPRILSLPDAVLRERLDAAAAFTRTTTARDGSERARETWAPDAVVQAVARAGAWPGLRELVGATAAPVLRPDGSVLARPGYDAATRLLYEPTVAYPEVSAAPTAAEVRAAWGALLHPFREFAFSGPPDRASTAALLLSVAARPAIEGGCPAWLVRAPDFGTGKTLLAEAATWAMTGAGPDVYPTVAGRKADADAEWRKRVLAILLEAPRVAVIDNVADGSRFGTDALSTVLTSGRISDRRLGATEAVHASATTMFVLTGNNVSLAEDMVRRFLGVDIDPKVERPSQRVFEDPDLLGTVRRGHPALLTAALTVLRGYHVAGRPPHHRPPLGKFEAWDALVRGAVLWATGLAGGEVDPLATQDALLEESTHEGGLGDFVDAWRAAFGSSAMTAAEVVRRAEGSPDLREALLAVGVDRNGDPDARRLGRYLGTNARKVVRGARFARTGTRSGAERWRVEVAGAPPAAGSGPAGGDVEVAGEVVL